MPSEGYSRLAPEGSLLAGNALLLDACSGHGGAVTASVRTRKRADRGTRRLSSFHSGTLKPLDLVG